MGFNYNDALSAFLILFAVIDILGNIPIIVSLRKKVGHVQSEKATIVAGAIMIVFLFVGESILNLLGVNVQSFAIAGSLVIFFLALEMILGITLYKEETPNTASIVPIAFPLIAGAGTMTSLISIRAEFATINILIAIVRTAPRRQVDGGLHARHPRLSLWTLLGHRPRLMQQPQRQQRHADEPQRRKKRHTHPTTHTRPRRGLLNVLHHQ